MTKGYTGWLLPQHERERLLALFPTRFSRTIAHHCTLEFGVDQDTPLPEETTATVVGESWEPTGVQALVLKIGGTIRRPDGQIYHITWSLEPGRRPVESNQVIRDHGWVNVPLVEIAVEPRWFPLKTG